MSVTPLSVILVGAGGMAHNHARVLSGSPSMRLDMVVDVNAERAAKLAAEVGCEWSTTIPSGRWDASIVATTPETHTAIATELLGRGIPVLVEKPIAMDIDDVRLVLSTSERLGVPLMCGFVERFNAVIETARSILDEPPVHIVGIRHSPPNPRATASVVHDLLVHDADLVTLFNPGAALVHACGTTWESPQGISEVADALLRFDNGMIASLSASRAGQRKVRSLSVATATQLIELDLLRQDITVYQHIDFPLANAGPHYRARTLIDIPFVRHIGEPLALELEHFAALARGELDMASERASLLAPHLAIAAVAR